MRTDVRITVTPGIKESKWVNVQIRFDTPVGAYLDYGPGTTTLAICSVHEDGLARLEALRDAAAKAIAEYGALTAPKEDTTDAQGN
jgi:hypothetical protein